MPELPEVETVRRGLSSLIMSRRIASYDYDWPKSFPNSDADSRQFLVGATVTAVERRAKLLFIHLSSDYSLAVHLKMTGQLVYVPAKESTQPRFGAGHPNDSLVDTLPDKSTRVTIHFDDGGQLYFNDQRKFGWMKLLPTALIPELDFMRRVGPEPLSLSFTVEEFKKRFTRRSKTTIKAALLDQSVIAGVGNIYADESLWMARIHPATRVDEVSATKLNRLYHALRDVMNLAIERGGSSDRNYIKADGTRGGYLDFANVFRREGLPCPRHPDELIKKIRVAGRGTHICQRCQVQ